MRRTTSPSSPGGSVPAAGPGSSGRSAPSSRRTSARFAPRPSCRPAGRWRSVASGGSGSTGTPSGSRTAKTSCSTSTCGGRAPGSCFGPMPSSRGRRGARWRRFFRQYFLYARGDGHAGLWPRAPSGPLQRRTPWVRPSLLGVGTNVGASGAWRPELVVYLGEVRASGLAPPRVEPRPARDRGPRAAGRRHRRRGQDARLPRRAAPTRRRRMARR